MTDPMLESAEELLLQILTHSGSPMRPSQLLAEAFGKAGGVSSEALRMALWSLLSRGAIRQTSTHQLATVNEPAVTGTRG